MTAHAMATAALPPCAPATPAAAAVYTLHPGDVACVDRGERLETLLGSCVAIVLTDPRRTVGAMCHIVHAQAEPSADSTSGTYAHVALEIMYDLLRQRGIAPQLCEAYVYGGGNMFPDIVWESDVGSQNVRWVLDALAADGIHVLRHDTGGKAYRRLGWTVGPGNPQVTAIQV